MDAAPVPPRAPSDAGHEWYAPRIERCTELIGSLSTELVRVGTPSVLEIGLTRRAARAGFYERARAAQLRVQLHALDAPIALRWQRVEARNHARGATFAMEVTREMFDFVEQMWEPPSERELLEHDGERVDTSAPLANR